MELDSFLLNGKIKYKIFSIISNSFMDIKDEDTISKSFSFPITFAQFFDMYHTTLHSFQPRRTFCILCAATLASSSESDSLWDVEL